MIQPEMLCVETLGECLVESPLNLSLYAGALTADYVSEDARVLLNVETFAGNVVDTRSLLEKAGPRRHIFFEPAAMRAAIVTCGGLCPGLNNVVRAIVLELHHKYGVRDVLGFRYGYEGLNPDAGVSPVSLGPSDVRQIHRTGGSVLGLGRGGQDVGVMVDTLVRYGVDALFAVGGDGTLRGAHAIAREVKRRGLSIAIVGVPKTIDNDVAFVDKTFGFDTAVEMARLALDAAHTEAEGARNGIGLVKLMGRDSGFIAAQATLASADVNYCLVPEVAFELEGPHGLFTSLDLRMAERAHALIVVAEGCDLGMATDSVPRDASGNIRYGSAEADIGPRLREALVGHFKERHLPITLKYIDPSYMIRSVPANANDAVFCDQLGRNAVHAAMAGKTDVVIGRWHGLFTYVPCSVATSQRKRIDPDSDLWLAVTEATGQPPLSAEAARSGRRGMPSSPYLGIATEIK